MLTPVKQKKELQTVFKKNKHKLLTNKKEHKPDIQVNKL